MYDYSIEQSANSIYDSKTKDYFKEVLNSYFNENYRSALVMLWTVVVCDLIFKLKDLKDIHNDEAAVQILQEIEQMQKNEPKSPSWELSLLKKIKDKTKLLENHEFLLLEELQTHRHLSAHPVLNQNDILFSPTRELVLANIRNALEAVLTKPPIFSKNIFDVLVNDLEKNKDIFPEDNNLERYLISKYFKNINDQTIFQIFKSLWQLTFKVVNNQCNNNRQINYRALKILFLYKKDFLTAQIKKSPSSFSQLSDAEPLIYAVSFMGDFPQIYPFLEDHIQEVINAKVDTDINYRIAANFLHTDMKAHISELIIYIENNQNKDNFNVKYIQENAINDLVARAKLQAHIIEANQLLIKIYSVVHDYDTADKVFSIFIKPYIDEFNNDNMTLLLSSISNNSQTYDRWRAKNEHRIVVTKARELIPDLDATAYPNLPW